jgi:RNA polymerase sigma factor (sigma-70 family)
MPNRGPLPTEVYLEHEKMIWSIVHTRFKWAYATNQLQTMLRRPMDAEDLFQEGCLGLAHAWDRFSGRRGVKFSTFAYLVVSRYISQYVMSHCRPIRVRKPLGEDGMYTEAQYRALGCKLFSEVARDNVTKREGMADDSLLVDPDADKLPVHEAIALLQECLTTVELRILMDRCEGGKFTNLASKYGMSAAHLGRIARDATERARMALEEAGYGE